MSTPALATPRRETTAPNPSAGQTALRTDAPRGGALQLALRCTDYPGGVQLLAPGGASAATPVDVHAAAEAGTAGSGGSLPHAAVIQKAFGRHDISGVQAYGGAAASEATQSMGAKAFATGDKVAYDGSLDLHTAAHEAAHVVQQRGGVSLSGGVGRSGDAYEQHADAVADLVVAGQSAESLLDEHAGGGGGGGTAGIQRSDDATAEVERSDEKPYPSEMTAGCGTAGDRVPAAIIYFPTAESALDGEDVDVLDQTGVSCSNVLATAKLDVDVEGFADHRGSEELNANLSQGRADSVASYLSSLLNTYDAFQLRSTIGKGELAQPPGASSSRELADHRFAVVYTSTNAQTEERPPGEVDLEAKDGAVGMVEDVLQKSKAARLGLTAFLGLFGPEAISAAAAYMGVSAGGALAAGALAQLVGPAAMAAFFAVQLIKVTNIAPRATRGLGQVYGLAWAMAGCSPAGASPMRDISPDPVDIIRVETHQDSWAAGLGDGAAKFGEFDETTQGLIRVWFENTTDTLKEDYVVDLWDAMMAELGFSDILQQGYSAANLGVSWPGPLDAELEAECPAE